MDEEAVAGALRRSTREPEAFLRLYDEHASSLLAFLARRVHEADAALDLTAETFAQAYAARHRFRGDTDAAATSWLYTIARRQLARYLRGGRAERRALARLGISVPQLTEGEVSRIEELADLERLRTVIRAELERLSASQREALRLRLFEDLPYPLVARRLGISEEAARARVSRDSELLPAHWKRLCPERRFHEQASENRRRRPRALR
ncbi:MAG: RNA polymerase sigma factor [bacterium]